MTTQQHARSSASARRSRVLWVSAIGASFGATLAACGSVNSSQDDGAGRNVACTADFRYGLNVRVLDAITGAPVPRPLLIVATDGMYADTARSAREATPIPDAQSWPLVGERAGRYTVLVRASGYADWTQPNVVITKDVCHVIPVALTARLSRRP